MGEVSKGDSKGKGSARMDLVCFLLALQPGVARSCEHGWNAGDASVQLHQPYLVSMPYILSAFEVLVECFPEEVPHVLVGVDCSVSQSGQRRFGESHFSADPEPVGSVPDCLECFPCVAPTEEIAEVIVAVRHDGSFSMRSPHSYDKRNPYCVNLTLIVFAGMLFSLPPWQTATPFWVRRVAKPL